MSKYVTDLRIGYLFVKAGLISADQLGEAAKLADVQKTHIGQSLLALGFVQPQALRAAITAQSLMRDSIIDSLIAGKALTIACKAGVTLEEALRRLGVVQRADIPTSKLGELLVEGKLINQDTLDAAIKKSFETGLPLGRVLVLDGAIQESTLQAVLEVQLRLRDGMLTREQAVEAVSLGADEFIGLLDESMVEEPITEPTSHKIRVGELFVLAGLLTKADVLAALEMGISCKRPIGEMLVGLGFVSRFMLDAGLNLQQMVDNGFVNPSQAAKCLSYVYPGDKPISQALVDLGLVKDPHYKGTGGPTRSITSKTSFPPKEVAESPDDELKVETPTTAEIRVPKDAMKYNYACALRQTYLRLAHSYLEHGRLPEAEGLYWQILLLAEKFFQPDDRRLASDLCNLAGVLYATNRHDQCEPFLSRAIFIIEKAAPVDWARLATYYSRLGSIYTKLKKFEEAEAILKKAMGLRERHIERNHPVIADVLRDYAKLLLVTERHTEAEEAYGQARKIILAQSQEYRGFTQNRLPVLNGNS